MRAYQAALSPICAPVCHSCGGVQEQLEAHLHKGSLRELQRFVSGPMPIHDVILAQHWGGCRSPNKLCGMPTLAILSAVSLKSMHFPVFDLARNSSMSLIPMLYPLCAESTPQAEGAFASCRCMCT